MGMTRRKIQLPDTLRQQGILRPRDLPPYGISSSSIGRLYQRGEVERAGRGLYYFPDAEIVTEHHTLVEACKRVPHGVVCLLSALQFHNLGTQAPHQVWLAIDRKARRPQVDYPALRIVRFSGHALTEGVEVRTIEGVTVRIYNPAKTVADCFKYRHKIGLDIALEALREARRLRLSTNDELWHYAQVCRVANVMKPYLEAIG
ncbi:MAG: type IV toxin-antitoxin system AbiEi family antitoxin domain-containing protein [Anaerolineae bacterium]|nr:type IV toxin-antitoxin system AbiEi family antitoxin domain-containing protein [Anaerolineae bacterium]